MNCATYCRRGEGRSIRATEAEEQGKRPLTRAIPVVAKTLKIKRASARELLELQGPCEWHHASKYANEVNYYDPAEVVSAVLDPLAALPLLTLVLAGDLAERQDNFRKLAQATLLRESIRPLAWLCDFAKVEGYRRMNIRLTLEKSASGDGQPRLGYRLWDGRPGNYLVW